MRRCKEYITLKQEARYDYWIYLEDINTIENVHAWVKQLGGKCWMNRNSTHELKLLLLEVLYDRTVEKAANVACF